MTIANWIEILPRLRTPRANHLTNRIVTISVDASQYTQSRVYARLLRVRADTTGIQFSMISAHANGHF